MIFRPWHEMNGGWFWWGANSCTPEQYKMLYIKTYVTLMKADCDNIVWAWSPNLSDKKDVDSFLRCYPGGDFVDLIGVDIYEFATPRLAGRTPSQRFLPALPRVMFS